MELDVTSAFPTFIGSVRTPDAEAMNHALHDLILAEEAEYPSLGRSNIGGWHSRPDFLHRSDPTVAALTSWITGALIRMIRETAGQDAFKGTLSISAWATICRWRHEARTSPAPKKTLPPTRSKSIRLSIFPRTGLA